MELSVVIPCYNGAETIGETLESLASQQWDEEWEVVFSDNGSTDRSRIIAETYIGRIPNLRIVDTSVRSGQPYALNAGVEVANGKSIVLCDADDVPAAGWLAAMCGALREHNIVACRMDIEKLNSPWMAAYRPNPQSDGLQKIEYAPYLFHAAGTTLGFRKELHQKIGGFDNTLPFLHDTDFCFRAQLAGYEMYFVHNAVLCYRLRCDMESIHKQAKYYGEYNMILYKRYLSYGEPQKNRWKRFYQAWKALLKAHYKDKPSLQEQANYLWQLGWELGRLKGVLKYRVSPF